MMTLSKQRKFTFNSLLEDIRGSQCCVIKVRQYILEQPEYFTSELQTSITFVFENENIKCGYAVS